ncbi:hypothetical protein GE09DRAFT_1227533 [Coniochaeta sp. 2T2.1]|nr:hypothetical protein GE09DRAFT_1227533 [Coniochaeta sp. 2T2.1]
MKSPTTFLTCFLLLWGNSYAADCTVKNDVFPWSTTGVDLMWDMRNTVCNKHWNENTQVFAGITTKTKWCNYGNCYTGFWEIRWLPNQQYCWDIMSHVIQSCMRYQYFPNDNIDTWNGGIDSRPGAPGKQRLVQGWLWLETRNRRRDGAVPDFNVTLGDTGSAEPVSKMIWLDYDENGNSTIALSRPLDSDLFVASC